LSFGLHFLAFSFDFLPFPQPSKPKDFANPFTESNAQTLRAGFELHLVQIIRGGPGRGFAEHGQQLPCKQTKK